MLRRVEIVGERGDGAAVERRLAVRVAAGREQQHRPAQRLLQLPLVEGDVAARNPRQHRPALVDRACLELRLEPVKPVAHRVDAHDVYAIGMRDVLDEIRRAAAAGEPVAVATVVAARNGSAPRPIGSKLAVTADGRLVGSVSGGCVEADVAERAKEVLAGADATLLTYGIADEQAWGVGLPCGSEIDVWLERADPELWESVAKTVDQEEHAVLSTDLQTGEKRLEAGADTVTGVEDGVFAERIAPPLRLLVFGATDIAEALCAIGGTLGWRTVVSDPRAGLATTERVPSAGELHLGWPDEALELVDEGTAVVVLTHEERLDLPALAGALRRGARYVGALGSKRVQERRRTQLAEEGLSEEQIARMSGPAGLDLGGRAPGEVALAIAAEIVATVSGKTKGSPKAPPSQPAAAG